MLPYSYLTLYFTTFVVNLLKLPIFALQILVTWTPDILQIEQITSFFIVISPASVLFGKEGL